jgi:hypothetical protein
MKKIEDLYFTVSIILSSARNFEQFHFFYQLLKIDTWNTYGILFFVKQLTFFCWADDFFKKVSSSWDSSSCISSSWPWLIQKKKLKIEKFVNVQSEISQSKRNPEFLTETTVDRMKKKLKFLNYILKSYNHENQRKKLKMFFISMFFCLVMFLHFLFWSCVLTL